MTGLRALLVAVAVGSLVSWWLWLAGPAPVATQLETLLPAAPAAETAVLNGFRQRFERRGVVALVSQDDEALAAATGFVLDYFERSPEISVDAAIEQQAFAMIEALTPFRAELLAAADAASIQRAELADLQAELQRSLFGLPTTLRLLPLAQDPFNLFGRYAGSLLPRSGTGLRWEDGYFAGEAGGTGVTVIAMVDGTGAEGLDQAAALEARLTDLEARLRAEWPAVEVLIASSFRHIASAAQSAQREIGLFGGGALLGIVLLFALSFRGGRPLLFAVASIAFGCAVGIAAVAALHGQVHVIALVFGCSLIGVGVDYALHFICMGDPQRLSSLRGASLLALVSTSIAYLMMVQAQIPVVVQIATLSCAGLAGSWLFVVVLYDKVMRGAVPSDWSAVTRLAGRLQHVYRRVSAGQLLLLWGAAGLLASVMLAGFAGFDNSVRGLYRADESLLDVDRRVGELLGRASATQYVLVSGASIDDLLGRLAATTRVLDRLVGEQMLADYQSVSDVLPPRAQRDINLRASRSVYGAEGLVHRHLDLTDEARRRLIDTVQRPLRLSDTQIDELARTYYPHLWVGRLGSQYHAAVALFDPHPALADASLGPGRFVDVTRDWSNQLSSASRRAVVMFGLAVLLVGLLLMIWLRSLRSITIALIPLTSGVLVLALLSTVGAQITLFHVFGLYLVVGLGFDYGIFAWRDRSDDVRCYLAILLSALTTMLAFGLLGFSSMPMISSFGVTVMCGTILNLLLVPGLRLFRPSDQIS